jgi:TetR/AcrR family transcriptional regulator, regulator of biofilm formation and stress response
MNKSAHLRAAPVVTVAHAFRVRPARMGDLMPKGRGEARREKILRAALRLIGQRGPEAVTHRAVASVAGVPLGSTTYYFATKEDILEEAMLMAAEREVARLQGLIGENQTVEGWIEALVGQLSAPTPADRYRKLAAVELVVEAARRPVLRAQLREWQSVYVRMAEDGLRVAGSAAPSVDAPLLVAALVGLDLAQLSTGEVEPELLRLAIGRLLSHFTGAGAQTQIAADRQLS